MGTFSKTLLVSALMAGIAGGAFADTYSSGSSSVITTGPRVSQPMNRMAMAPNSNLLSDVPTIRSCLCLQQQSQNQSTMVANKQAAYNQAVSQKNSLDSMVASAKAGTNPNLDQVRQASMQSIELGHQINMSLLPDLQNATAQYNQSVASYQQSCGTKSYDADALAQAKTGLMCQGG
jgi:hypothetical protein